MTSPTDSRQHPRIPMAHEVKLVAEDRIIACPRALNLSLGGILVEGVAGLPVGSDCGVAILLVNGDPGRRVVARGTVVRSDAQGVAIDFSRSLDPLSRRALQMLIQSLEAPGEGDGLGLDPPPHQDPRP